jgi:hypothetical protein
MPSSKGTTNHRLFGLAKWNEARQMVDECESEWFIVHETFENIVYCRNIRNYVKTMSDRHRYRDRLRRVLGRPRLVLNRSHKL